MLINFRQCHRREPGDNSSIMKICDFSKEKNYVGKLIHIKMLDGREESGVVLGQKVNENNDLVIKYAKSEGDPVSINLREVSSFDFYEPLNDLDQNKANDAVEKLVGDSIATFLSDNYADSSHVDWKGWEFIIEALDIDNSQIKATYWNSNLWKFKAVANIIKIDKRQTVHTSSSYKVAGNAEINLYKRIGGSVSSQNTDIFPYVKKVVITSKEGLNSNI